MIEYREVVVADVPGLVEMRGEDPEMGPADARMVRYLLLEHHPGHALEPRVMFMAERDGRPVGYIGGHLTTRFDCDGELQYLYVAPDARRLGVATGMLDRLVAWFGACGARRVCVDVTPENERARSFYRRHGATDLNAHWLVWEDIGAR